MLKIISNILYFLGIISVIIVFPGTWISDGFSEAYGYLLFGIVIIAITFLLDKFISYREKKGNVVANYGNKFYWYLGAGVLMIFVFVSIADEKYPQAITLFFLSIGLFGGGRKAD